MNEIIYISDFFVEHIRGGGELNDHELINILKIRNYSIKKVQSHQVTLRFLESNDEKFFIISNFCNLKRECKNFLTDACNYLIYEHDHKYTKNRNPALYENFKAPKREIINYFFYKNATAVICQSSFHEKIITLNLGLKNIVNISGNFWSLSTLNFLKKMSERPKKKACSILNSTTEHKNTKDAVKFCNLKKLEYELVADSVYFSFLEKLGANEKFVFFPKTPETLSRVVIEARMMGLSVITNKNVGATYEEWFKLKGKELIDYFVDKREEIADTVENNIKKNKRRQKEISIISTFHEGENFLKAFLDDVTSQTIFQKCELIFVDADSRGKEENIIKNYMKKFDNIRYHRLDYKATPTQGLNLAIQKSSGRYLTFGLIDDRRKADCLQMLLKNMSANIALTYGDCLVTNKENETFERNTANGKLFEHSKNSFSAENMIKCLPGPMPLWKKEIHENCGFFDEDECDYADDWEMWLRAVSCGYKFKKVEKPLGLYLEGGRSQQKNNFDQRREEAEIFYKYKNLFGKNFQKFKPYFDQFLR
tara:strand:+ start:12 stop:1625 length:1614 start_codon:yes stop_codon:yes gene_type:complete